MAKLVLAAGYDRSPVAIAVCELLHRQGATPSAILLVSDFSVEHIRSVLRLRGWRPLIRYALRRSASLKQPDARSPLLDFIRRLGIQQTSIRRWARNARVPCLVVPHLNHQSAIDAVRKLENSVVLYTGGGLLRQPFLDACQGRAINAHVGSLPELRGMNALEWSLLLGVPPTITVHLIDAGIDTGPVLERIPLELPDGQTIEELREHASIAASHALVKWGQRALRGLPPGEVHKSVSRQCFVLAPALRRVLEKKLAGQRGSTGS